MRYPLLGRFQGNLLGAALGDSLGDWQQQKNSQTHYDTALSGRSERVGAPVDLAYWQPGLVTERDRTGAKSEQSPWGDRAIATASALIQAGGQERLMAAIHPHLVAKNGSASKDNLLELTAAKHCYSEQSSDKPLATAELAIATLPVTLFFHDNEIKLQEKLRQMLQGWHGHPESEARVLAVSFAIAQLLKERLEPCNLIPKTIDLLNQHKGNLTAETTAFISRLEQVQKLVQQRAGLQVATAQMRAVSGEPVNADDRAIALAFYCFLSTPDDPRLAMLRAVRSSDVPSVVGALTGALSGTYNSLSGLPLTWRTTNQPSQVLRWGISGTALCQLAARLYATWSGVYDPTGSIDALSAIAAPGVIRPR